jgi:hypothetical protein
MEAAVDGGSGNGVFAAAVNANEGTVAAAPTAAAQLTTTTTIAAATIGRRRHCQQCHCVIVHPSHRHLYVATWVQLVRRVAQEPSVRGSNPSGARVQSNKGCADPRSGVQNPYKGLGSHRVHW